MSSINLETNRRASLPGMWEPSEQLESSLGPHPGSRSEPELMMFPWILLRTVREKLKQIIKVKIIVPGKSLVLEAKCSGKKSGWELWNRWF